METIILYGSATGNAEEMSKYLSKIIECDKKEINDYTNKLEDLNNFEKVIFICSTTGNGDFPENALIFWKKIKKRDLKNDLLKDLKFSVCALGDTNYSHFCESGKKLSKRLKELAAEEIKPIFYIDAVDDEEEQFNNYINIITEN